MKELITTIDTFNCLAKVFRKARDIYETGDSPNLSIRLIGIKNRGRKYDMPTTYEIAGLIMGDLKSNIGERYVIVHHKSAGLQQISDLHPLFMTLQCPLLFPYDEIGFHEGIPTVETEGNTRKRTFTTNRELYAYQIQTRLREGMTIVRSKRILNQYIVDAYTAIEQERLRWCQLNLKKLRANQCSKTR